MHTFLQHRYIYYEKRQILNMKDEEVFLNYINENYDKVKSTLQIISGQRHQAFDEDIFHDTILRCHKTIKKRGELKDKTPYGITSYLMRSYFTNILEDKRSAKHAKRDLNYDSDNISELYEDWYNSNNSDAKNKILTDTFKDFSVLYLMLKAEEQFAFTALPYTPMEIESADHMEALPLPRRTVLTVYGAVRGVGGMDSWGADVEEAYHVSAEEDIRVSFIMS